MERFAAQNMVRVVVYAVCPQDADALEPLLRKTILSRRQWPLIQKFSGDLPGFLRYVSGNPYLIMLAAAPGPGGPVQNGKDRMGRQDIEMEGYGHEHGF